MSSGLIMTYSSSARILGGLEPALDRLLEIDGESFSGCADLRFRHFVAYWGRLAAARGAYPSRTAIDPSVLGRDMLPNLFLVDIVIAENRPLRYRFRLVGDGIATFVKAGPGRFLDDISIGGMGAVERHFAAAVRGEAYLRRSDLGWQDRMLERVSTLVLPLADNGKTPTHLFGLSIHDPGRA
jgi:hypothetical protein